MSTRHIEPRRPTAGRDKCRFWAGCSRFNPTSFVCTQRWWTVKCKHYMDYLGEEARGELGNIKPTLSLDSILGAEPAEAPDRARVDWGPRPEWKPQGKKGEVMR